MPPPPLVDMVDTPLPMPENVARRIGPFHRLMRSRYIGVMVFFVCSLSITVQPLLVLGPICLLLAWLGVVGSRRLQRFCDLVSGWYMAIVVLLFEKMLGIQTRSFGHQERFKPRSLFLMNHVCHFDWMFFWGIVERQGDIACWKAVTKNAIKKVPLIGIAMQYMCHIFITRRWQDDKEEFRKKLFYYNALNIPVQLLLFPEGGDLNLRSKARSDKFANTNHLPRYDYCLHPRTTGFLYVMKALRSGHLDAVYDVTVAYPDALAKTELDMVNSKYMPCEIHYLIRHYRAEDLPTGDKELSEWLSELWRKKEEKLKEFYVHKRFLEPAPKSQGNGNTTMPQLNGCTGYVPVPEVNQQRSYPFVLSAIAFFLFLMVLLTYFFLTSWLWCGCVVVMSAYTVHTGLTKGIDAVLTDLAQEQIEQACRRCHDQEKASSTPSSGHSSN